MIGLARAGLLRVLGDVFAEVLVPGEVARECTREGHRPGAGAIRQAIDESLLTVRDVSPSDVLTDLATVLDRGEAEALLLADALGVPVLMDDRKGRAAARHLGVRVIGTGAVLVAAKGRGSLGAVAPALARLRDEGYQLSDQLVRRILELAGE